MDATIGPFDGQAGMRAPEIRLAQIIEHAPIGMILVDTAGHIALVNAHLERIFGHDRADLLGKPLEMLLPERYRHAHGGHRANFIAQPTARAMGVGRDLMARHANGSEFAVEVGLNPLRTADGVMVLAAVTDISRRKKLERELQQANANLEEFTYLVSHDMKSPLRGIATLMEWIGEELGAAASPELVNNLQRVTTRVERLERMIDDLLAYAHAGQDASETALIEPTELILGIVEILPRPPGFDIAVTSSASAFRAVRAPLETVLRNLIANALKHHDRLEGRIEIDVAEDDQHCVFTVADDGPGVPEARRARIFRLFQRMSSNEGASSGIGLALSKRLVEAHGGRLALEPPRLAGGATFRVWWPRFERRRADG